MKKFGTAFVLVILGAAVLAILALAVGCKHSPKALVVPLAPNVPVTVRPISTLITNPVLVPLVTPMDGVKIPVKHPAPKPKPVVAAEPTFLVDCPKDTSKPCERVKKP